MPSPTWNDRGRWFSIGFSSGVPQLAGSRPRAAIREPANARHVRRADDLRPVPRSPIPRGAGVALGLRGARRWSAMAGSDGGAIVDRRAASASPPETDVSDAATGSGRGRGAVVGGDEPAGARDVPRSAAPTRATRSGSSGARGGTSSSITSRSSSCRRSRSPRSCSSRRTCSRRCSEPATRDLTGVAPELVALLAITVALDFARAVETEQTRVLSELVGRRRSTACSTCRRASTCSRSSRPTSTTS